MHQIPAWRLRKRIPARTARWLLSWFRSFSTRRPAARLKPVRVRVSPSGAVSAGVALGMIAALALAPFPAYAASLRLIGKALGLNTGAYLDFGGYNSTGIVSWQTGNFSGYVWSEDVGWVDFGTDQNPAGPVTVNTSTGVVSGKAYVINTGAYIDFNAVPYSSNVTVNPATGVFSGYGWSEDVGWLNFSDTGVMIENFTADAIDASSPALSLQKIGTLDYSSKKGTYYYTGSRPTFSGTGEVGAAVTLRINSTTRASGTIGSNGSWSLGGYAFPSGSHTVQLTAADASGNQTSLAFTLVISPDWGLFPSWLVSQLTGEELYPAEEGPPSVEEESEEEEPVVKGNTLTIRLTDRQGKPLAGIWVTLASEPQTAQTDRDGVAVFTNVLPGEHTLSFVYGGQTVERALNLTDDDRDYKLDVTVEGAAPEGFALTPQWVLWGLGGLTGLFALLFIFRRRLS